MGHPFGIELIQITEFLLLHENARFHKQQNELIIPVILQMEPLNIIGKNAFIGMIKANYHSVAVVIYTENILIQ